MLLFPKGMMRIILSPDFCSRGNTNDWHGKTELPEGWFEPPTVSLNDRTIRRKSLPDFASEGILEAMPVFGRKLRGFDSDKTVITGVESKFVPGDNGKG